MKPSLSLLWSSCAVVGAVVAAPAGATALIGGTIGTFAGDGACHDNQQVSTSTEQDFFHLVAATGCGGSAADGELMASALAPSIGLYIHASGTTTASGAGALVSLLDRWTINVPPSIPANAEFTLPISFRIEGTAAGNTGGFGRYLEVSGAFGPFYGTAEPFRMSLIVTSPGAFGQTFSGSATFRNFYPSPTLASFEMVLSAPHVSNGAVDALHTLSATVDLPPGFSITSSSGAVLFAPVPEPATLALMLLGLGAVGMRSLTRSAGPAGIAALS